jgi:hypothetical protein
MTRRPEPFASAFAGRDPAPAAAVLRQMALAALAETVGGAPVSAPPDAAPLSDWLGEDPAKGAAVQGSLRLLQRALLFGQVNEAAPVSRALVAGALPAGRLAHLRDWFALRWRRAGKAVAPPGSDVFGPALAALAFGDATFRRSIVTMIRDHLGGRVLFHPDAAPVPVLSAACCMVLIAARTDPADQTPVTQGLRTLAATLAARAGWAAFWDQWVLHVAAGNATFALPDTVRTLPLLAHGTVAFAQPAEENDLRVDPDWRNGLPAYSQYLLARLP